jgi:hypothetical protein
MGDEDLEVPSWEVWTVPIVAAVVVAAVVALDEEDNASLVDRDDVHVDAVVDTSLGAWPTLDVEEEDALPPPHLLLHSNQRRVEVVEVDDHKRLLRLVLLDGEACAFAWEVVDMPRAFLDGVAVVVVEVHRGTSCVVEVGRRDTFGVANREQCLHSWYSLGDVAADAVAARTSPFPPCHYCS